MSGNSRKLALAAVAAILLAVLSAPADAAIETEGIDEVAVEPVEMVDLIDTKLPLAKQPPEEDRFLAAVAAPPSVPEPSTLAIWSLLGAGAAAGAAKRRRRHHWSKRDREAIYGVIERR